MKTKRTVLNKLQKETHEVNGALLSFKWTISRGRKRYAVVYFNDSIGCMTSGELYTSNDLLCASAYADTF